MHDVVQLKPYDLSWPTKFATEAARIRVLLPLSQVEHIGSTSVPNLSAKPIIDIIIGVPNATIFEDYLHLLQKGDYLVEGQRQNHAWLCRTLGNQREFIAHLVLIGGKDWQNRRAFRDYLIDHSNIAQQYLALKSQFARKYTYDLGSYTKAKGVFVASVTATALADNEKSYKKV